MTPAELLAMVQQLEELLTKGSPRTWDASLIAETHNALPTIASALRSYAELVACLSWRREQGLGGSVDVVAESKAIGWPGLEEL